MLRYGMEGYSVFLPVMPCGSPAASTLPASPSEDQAPTPAKRTATRNRRKAEPRTAATPKPRALRKRTGKSAGA